MTRVALVTGAAQGIGRAIALRLARDGFALALADLNAEGTDRVKQEIEQAGGKALPIEADLVRLSELERAVACAADWGSLAVLVNNAGRVTIRPFLQVSEAEWDAVLALDLKTVFFAMQFAARRMERASASRDRLPSPLHRAASM
jgi:NAD(P)-dependent dehydrogenase (short-subunit alcohol dehydrogenase family)